MPQKPWALAVLWCMLLGLSVHRQTLAEGTLRTNDTFSVDVWLTENGLPQNEVTSIIQARDGYLWFGTLNGLVRFDGMRFRVFDESNTPGLESSRILFIFEDHSGRLWLGTETAGVLLFQSGRAIKLDFETDGRKAQLVAACEDPQGAVWLSMANGQLWRCANKQPELLSPGSRQASDYHGLFTDSSGTVWVASDQGAAPAIPDATTKPPALANVPPKLDYLLPSRAGGYWALANLRIWKWRGSEPRPEIEWGYYPWIQSLSSARLAGVAAACEDQHGNLIVASRDKGVFWFDAKGDASGISTNQGLSSNHILALCLDREGDLWVGTDGGGLDRVKRPLFQVLEQSRNLVAQSMAIGDSNSLWIAYNNAPLSQWKDGTLTLYRLPREKAVVVDRQQQVWVGASGGLFQINGGQLRGMGEWFVSALYEDRQGRLWVGTDQGLARRDGDTWSFYTSTNGLSADSVQAIAEDPDGSLWIGTRGGGLDRFAEGKFTIFRKSAGGLPGDNIGCLHVDPDGVLWVGTDGGGLGRFQRGKWTRYTRQDGLVSNSIGYMIEDGQGYLWLGSNAGLMRVEKRKLNDFAAGLTNGLTCRVYGRSDGLPTSECSAGSQPAACLDSAGRLWFPTIKGVASVQPAELKVNSNAPPVIIETVSIDGQPQPLDPSTRTGGTELKVPAGRQRLQFEFTSINLSAPKLARFRYRLEGETSWNEVGSTRVADYPKLPPGHYIFQVTACNEDGIWNPAGATLAFFVLPPFWRTPWFIATMTAMLLASTAGIVSYLSTQKLQRELAAAKQKETLEKERSRIASDIHDQLGANLTQVALLGELVESDKDLPNEVEAHARQISQTARDTTRVLDEIVWAVNPSNDTLDGLMTYLCKYAQEYLTLAGLHYRLEMPPQLPNTPLPPEVRHNFFLACKEAITNVVRHSKATEARLKLVLEPIAFTVEIQDNGRGPGDLSQKSSRNGLKNMHKRMEDIGGAFVFGAAPSGGTLVRLTAPLKTGPENVRLRSPSGTVERW